jgi:hypothetical protein
LTVTAVRGPGGTDSPYAGQVPTRNDWNQHIARLLQALWNSHVSEKFRRAAAAAIRGLLPRTHFSSLLMESSTPHSSVFRTLNGSATQIKITAEWDSACPEGQPRYCRERSHRSQIFICLCLDLNLSLDWSEQLGTALRQWPSGLQSLQDRAGACRSHTQSAAKSSLIFLSAAKPLRVASPSKAMQYASTTSLRTRAASTSWSPS